MSEPNAAPNHPQPDALRRLAPDEQRAVLRAWRGAGGGLSGARGQLPASPDDAVAHALLNAAGIALGQGRFDHGARILQLTAQDYPRSQEAGCARTVLDRLAERSASRGR